MAYYYEWPKIDKEIMDNLSEEIRVGAVGAIATIFFWKDNDTQTILKMKWKPNFL